MTFGPVSGQRSGGIDFKRLIQGTPGAPDNFEVSLVRTAGDYYAHSALRVEAADSGMTLEVDEEVLLFAITLPLFG